MPEGWNAVDNNWWERYFNTLVSQFDGGINPESIITLEGPTITIISISKLYYRNSKQHSFLFIFQALPHQGWRSFDDFFF